MFVDIHSHILPGIDDGAANAAETLAMLKLAAQDRTRHIVATPHFSPQNTSDVLRAKTDELLEQAVLNNIDIKIYPGSEVLLGPDTPGLIENGKIAAINGSRYILVEFPMTRIPVFAPEILYRIQLKGLIPIIAHAERYADVIADPACLREYVERGMLVQITAGSLTGFFGRKVRNTAWVLLRSGMAHFVASDAHGSRGRTPLLSKAAAMVEKKLGEKLMRELFYSNGMAVLENRELYTEDQAIALK